MSADEATAELTKREIAFAPVRDGARGVLAPVRLTGPLHGVSWHTELPAARRAESPWEVFDARLVLSLDDYGAILARHDVDEVIIFSAWRPPAKSWPEGKQGIRHPGALAVDAKRFHRKASDTWLDVLDDFHGAIGATTCGPGAAAPSEAPAKELRQLACEAYDARLFQSILTPNYNRPHRNHFHMEVRQGVSWMLIH
jgi:hypothetical protein